MGKQLPLSDQQNDTNASISIARSRIDDGPVVTTTSSTVVGVIPAEAKNCVTDKVNRSSTVEMEGTHMKGIRQRNAVYSKRQYYKNKMFVEELQTKTEHLVSTNCKLRIENQQLQDTLQRAQQEVIRRMSHNSDSDTETSMRQQQQHHHQYHQQMDHLQQSGPTAAAAAVVALSNQMSENTMSRASTVLQQQQVSMLYHPLSPPPREVDSAIADFAVLEAVRQQRQQQRYEEELSLLLYLQQDHRRFHSPFLYCCAVTTAIPIPIPPLFRLGYPSLPTLFDLNSGNTEDISL